VAFKAVVVFSDVVSRRLPISKFTTKDTTARYPVEYFKKHTGTVSVDFITQWPRAIL
jgi:hypothetical protein